MYIEQAVSLVVVACLVINGRWRWCYKMIDEDVDDDGDDGKEIPKS